MKSQKLREHVADDRWAYGEYDDCFGCNSVELGVEIDGEDMGSYLFRDGSTRSFTI